MVGQYQISSRLVRFSSYLGMAAAIPVTTTSVTPSASLSKTLNPRVARSLCFGSSFSPFRRHHLLQIGTSEAAGSRGSALGAQMVSVPSIGKAAPFLDFETSVFKKEKVTLSGNDEVFIPVTVDFVSLSLLRINFLFPGIVQV